MPYSSFLFFPIHLHRSTSGPPHGSTQFQNQSFEDQIQTQIVDNQTPFFCSTRRFIYLFFQFYFQGLDIHGRIYINEQGINAQYSGPSKHSFAYVEWLKEDDRF
ncbi:hypothetical protein V6Z12_D02G131400 [Gossypium hirsutum]